MKTIGWVRLGDKASCGGVVAEASSTETSHGKGYAFQGAAMDCKKGCKIADGHPNARLTNGKQRVTHGQRTSGGCALASTLNDVDGIGNASGSNIADAFKQDAEGNLQEIFLPRPLSLCAFDQHVVFVDEHGAELHDVPYQLADERGAVIAGITGSDGRTNSMGGEQSGTLTISLGAGETA
jgi:uncharacterized Zn-binding protein involved in type VI secretion